MKFFLDNNLPPKWAPALEALTGNGVIVQHVRDLFPDNHAVKDVQWIERLHRERGWTVLSGDLRITKNPHERAAFLSTDLTMFFLDKSWGSHTLWDKSWRIVRWWPRILEQAKLVKPPAAFVVPLNFGSGQFEQLTLRA